MTHAGSLQPWLNATADMLLQQLTPQAGYSDCAVLFFSLLGFSAYLTNGTLWDKPDPNHYKWFERPQESLNQSPSSKETRNIAQRLQESCTNLVIFWGSQSGTAENFAHRLARECVSRFKLEALVADLSDYDPDTIALIPDSKFALFVMSTYGEGDPSDNASEFWDWAKNNVQSLENLRYAAFGLGNTNYKFYNKVIDIVVEKLDHCRAKSILPVGKADDSNNGTEEDFFEWKESLFRTLKGKMDLTEHEQTYQPIIKVIEDPSLDIIDLHVSEPVPQVINRKTLGQTNTMGVFPIKQIRELTNRASPDRSCLHLELDVSKQAQIKYKTGDHLSVYPRNSEAEVNRLLQVLCLKSKKDIPLLISSLDPSNTKLKIPSPSNLSALFTSYLEIAAPVSREVVQALVAFAPSEASRSVLRSITKDKEAYADFLSTHHITLARVLEHALGDDPISTWSRLPLSFILEILHPMSPRHYSISSSSATSPKQISITIANTPTTLTCEPRITIPGLTANYLSNIKTSMSDSPSSTGPPIPFPPPLQTIYASIQRSTFKLPMSHKTPLILIGAGTGIAPLRAFIHERAALARIGHEIGDILMFYGCRDQSTDYLYRDEIETFLTTSLKGSLRVVTAFSRPHQHHLTQASDCDFPAGQRKGEYVQHRIAERENARAVASMIINDDAAVFFCGSTRMAKAAGDAVLAAVAARKECSADEAFTWRDERRRMGRWKEDVWG